MQDVHKYCTEMLVTDRGAERVRPATWEVKTRVALKSYLNMVFSKGLASDKDVSMECILNAEWLVQWLQWMLSGASREIGGRGPHVTAFTWCFLLSLFTHHV